MVKQRGRRLDGILVMDKPPGMTSNKLLQIVKRLFGAEKAGHTGSLDPMATGVLPLCFGEATKVSQYLLDADKGYRARVRLGVTTTTGDADGEVTGSSAVPTLSREQLDNVLSGFLGAIEQVPSVYSALKQDGVPLYKLARQGREIREKRRIVSIHAIALRDWATPELELDVRCSKGTYIRSLAEDIGRQLGCGAHLTALRRTAAGPFGLEACHTLAELETCASQGGQAALDALLIAPDQAIDWMPLQILTENEANRLKQGQIVEPAGECAVEGLVRVQAGGSFLGIARIMHDGRLQAVRLLRTDS